MNHPTGPINFLEFSFFRSLFLAVTAFGMMRKNDLKTTDVPKDCVRTLIFRCSVGTVTFIITAISLKMMPLSFYVLVLSTNPFVTGILLFIWLRQTIHCYEWIAIIGSYSGIVVISQA